MRAREATSSARAAAFETAVAISSAKLASRSSVPAGSGSGSSVPAISAPHTSPSTTTGAPTSERMPSRRSLGDQRGDPARGGLLVREPLQVLVGVAVCEGRGDELGELHQTIFGPR